jgi:hypothetical protein
MRSGLHLSVCAVAALFSISMAEAAPAPGACAFLTKAEVKPFAPPGPLFDRIAPEEQPTRTGSLCHYSGLTLGVDPFAFSFVEADRAKAPAQFVQVPGLGDLAYFRAKNSTDRAEIFVRTGQRLFLAETAYSAPETADGAKNRLIGLARAALAKMR